MKTRTHSFLISVILLFGSCLCALAGLTSCENFISGSNVKKQIEEQIAYANAQTCKLHLKTEQGVGSFLSGSEMNCKVGFAQDLQFTLNKEDYYFISLEAVALNDESQSREDFVQIAVNENESDFSRGIYKFSVKLLKPSNDILIKPKCIELPCISSYSPSESIQHYANTPIILYFNEPVEDVNTAPKDSLFNYKNISLIYNDPVTGDFMEMDDYFYPPEFNAQKTELRLSPNGVAIKKFIEEEKKAHYIEISVSFSDKIKIDFADEELSLGLKKNSNSSFKVRYNSDIEEGKPALLDFFVTKNEFSLDSEASYPGVADRCLENDYATLKNIEDPDILYKNLVPSTFYIYVKGYDAESGVRNIDITEAWKRSTNFEQYSGSGPKTTSYAVNAGNVKYLKDENGNSLFLVKYTLQETLKERPEAGCFELSVSLRDGCDNVSEGVRKICIINLEYGDLSYINVYNKYTDEYKTTTVDGATTYQGVFTIYNTPFSMSSANPQNYDFDKYNSDIKVIRIRDEYKPTRFYIVSTKSYVNDFELKYECEYIDRNGKKRVEPFSAYNSSIMERKLTLDVDRVSGMTITVLAKYNDVIIGRKKFVFPALTEMQSIKGTEVKLGSAQTNGKRMGLCKFENNSYRLVFITNENVSFKNVPASTEFYFGSLIGVSGDTTWPSIKISTGVYEYDPETETYSGNTDTNLDYNSNYYTFENTKNHINHGLFGEMIGPYYNNQTAYTKPGLPEYDENDVEITQSSQPECLDITLKYPSNLWDKFDSITMICKKWSGKDANGQNSYSDGKQITITSSDTFTKDDKTCYTMTLEKLDYFFKDGLDLPFATYSYGTFHNLKSSYKWQHIQLTEDQPNSFDVFAPSVPICRRITEDKKVVFYFYDNGAGPESGKIVNENGTSYNFSIADGYEKQYEVSIPLSELKWGDNTFTYQFTDKKGLTSNGTFVFSTSNFRLDVTLLADPHNLNEGPYYSATDSEFTINKMNENYLPNIYRGTASSKIYKYNSNTRKWSIDYTLGTDNINDPGSNSTTTLKEALNIQTGDNISFIKVIYVPLDYSSSKIYSSKICYAKPYNGNSSTNCIMSNGNSKTSVIISSDAKVLVQFYKFSQPLKTCKELTSEQWEFAGTCLKEEVLDFSTDALPKMYDFSSFVNSDILLFKNECYCVIVHFPDNSVGMSEVFLK